MNNINDPTVNMTDEKNAADDDAMRSSANALTKKLYLTVMDVFGNYVGNDEDDYNAMLETLRAKQMQKQKCATPAKSDDNRGIIAKKLLEGYALRGGVCDKCVMPLMAYEGLVSCVVCKKVEEPPKSKYAATEEPMSDTSDVEFALVSTSTTASDLDEEDKKEVFVNKELSQFNERRSQATHVFTAKILGGYVMQNQLCSKCDMPKMKYKDLVECVFCPKEVEPVKDEVKEAAKSDPVVEEKQSAEAPKPVKDLSQAEIIAERLRGVQSMGYGENVESELEKAESELLKMVEALGMQGNQSGEVSEASEALQDYFFKKKQDRVAENRLKEAADGIIEAEAVAALLQLCGAEEGIPQAERVDEMTVATENENGIVHPIAPATPQFESSIGCSIGDSFFPSFRNMFASASDPVKDKEEHTNANATNPSACRFEAKKRIAALVAEGWEVSADSCPQCELPLFSNSNGQIVNCLKRCVMCGPITENGNTGSVQGDSYDLVNLNKEAQEDITKKMVNRIMEGWSIAEDSQCPSCHIPTMFDPQTHLTHCIACEVLKEQGMMLTYMQQQATNTSTEGGQGSNSLNMHAMQSANLNKEAEADITEKMVNRIMEGWSVVEGRQCPSCYMPTMFDPQTHLTHCVACGVLKERSDPTPPKHATQNKLKIETASASTLKVLPDPTTSMYEFRGQLGREPIDPTTSMQVLKSKLNVTTEVEPTQHKTGEPTPARKTVRYMINEPTPNMQAVRNKLYVSTPPEPTRYTACDPTPNMQTARGKLINPTPSEQALQRELYVVTEVDPAVQHTKGNYPTPAMRTLQHKHNEPTPNMQAVQNKLNEPSHPALSMYEYRASLTYAPTHPEKIKGADPSPSNFHGGN